MSKIKITKLQNIPKENFEKQELNVPEDENDKRVVLFPVIMKVFLKILAMKQKIKVYYCETVYEKEWDIMVQNTKLIYQGRAMNFPTEKYGNLKPFKVSISDDYLEILADNFTGDR